MEKIRPQSNVIQLAAAEGAFGYVYAIGSLEARFSDTDIEKEYDQVAASMGVTDIYDVLKQSSVMGSLDDKGADNAYLAREMEWVFTIQNMDAWQVEPRTLIELGNMVEAINPASKGKYTVLIGTQEPLAEGGSDLPWVMCNRIYYFDPDAFAAEVVKRAADVGATVDAKTVTDFFSALQQFTKNAGDGDHNRTVNYLALNYVDFYIKKAEMDAANKPFTGLTTRPSTMSGGRKLLDAILSFNDRKYGNTERYYCTVDVTGQFPFMVGKLQPYLGE